MKSETRERWKVWGKRFGWSALVFYLIKGLVWLLIGWGAWSAFG